LLTRPQDIITGDEILSDSYDVKEIDGIAYEADCSRITVGVGEISGSQSTKLPLEYRTNLTGNIQTLAVTPRLKKLPRMPMTRPRPLSMSSTLSV
jgi:hypothetical protein